MHGDNMKINYFLYVLYYIGLLFIIIWTSQRMLAAKKWRTEPSSLWNVLQPLIGVYVPKFIVFYKTLLVTIS